MNETPYPWNGPKDNGQDGPPEPDRFEEAVEQEVFNVRMRTEARRRIAAEAAPPQPFDAALLSDVVIEPVRWRVEGLLPVEGRLLLAAQRKAGKTTLALNLARDLLLGFDHLGRFHVRPINGRVGFLNFEVSRSQLCLWAREAGVPGSRLLTVHLRGRRNPFADADGTARLADLLREHTVEVLMVDPFGRAFTGVNQNDAGEVGAFLSGLDRFATDAGVSELVLTAHAGWDGERTRGSSALEDWADAVVYLTRGKEKEIEKVRFFRAIGRDVEVDEDRLDYDPATRRLTMTGEGGRATARAEHKVAELVPAVAEAATLEPGCNTKRLEALMRGAGCSLQHNDVTPAAVAAAEAGLIVRVPGPHGSTLHYLAGAEPDPYRPVPTRTGGTVVPVPVPVPSRTIGDGTGTTAGTAFSPPPVPNPTRDREPGDDDEDVKDDPDSLGTEETDHA
jgi:hypothetical protein